MAEASHPDPSGAVHYNLPDDHVKRHGASFGLSIVCIILLVAAAVLAIKLRQQAVATADVRAQLERATSDTASAKTDLAKAGASLNDLHSQLDKANRQQADMTAQIKKLEQSNSDLQTQVQQAQTDLKAQQEKAQSQLADVQGQLSRANDTSSGLRSELATAKSQADALKAQLASMKTEKVQPQPVVAQSRELPLTTELKKSFWTGNFTLAVKNSSPDPLKLNLDITGSPKTPSRSATIEGNGTFKLSDIAPGATIAIASAGFSPITLTAK